MRPKQLDPKKRRQLIAASFELWGEPEKREATPAKVAPQNLHGARKAPSQPTKKEQHQDDLER